MFRAQFPEFNNVSDTLCTAMLSAASLEFDTGVWGVFGQLGGPITKADQGQMYLAAHKLAVSPFGQNARTVFKEGTYNYGTGGYDRTTYGREFLNLRYSVTSGFRVA
jgi:hypothetical protein